MNAVTRVTLPPSPSSSWVTLRNRPLGNYWCETITLSPMSSLVHEIVAVDAGAAADPEAQQRFHALSFPARHGSKVMVYLGTHFQSLPAIGYGHLKRMKKHATAPQQLMALVSPCETPADEACEACAEVMTRQSEMKQLFEGSVSSVLVLKAAPLTREVFDVHTRTWPLIFHTCVAPEVLVPPIEDDEALQMREFVAQAVAFAQKQQQQQSPSALRLPPCAHGCVIVDPNAGPEEQLAGESFTQSEQPAYALKSIYHPIMVAIDQVAARDRAREDAAGDEMEAARAKKQKQNEETKTDESAGDVGQGPLAAADKPAPSYLCTGYDIYLDREPCVTCAMALVHSRARRVVFAELNASDGALGSVFRLHTIASLNHHYRAFHLPLPTEEVATS